MGAAAILAIATGVIGMIPQIVAAVQAIETADPQIQAQIDAVLAQLAPPPIS